MLNSSALLYILYVSVGGQGSRDHHPRRCVRGKGFRQRMRLLLSFALSGQPFGPPTSGFGLLSVPLDTVVFRRCMAHPRDTGHCPDAPEPLWRRGHRVLQDALEEEGDELEVLRSKVVVCMTAALCGGCGILWALCYCVLGAFYAAVFPATMVLVCVFSAASLLRTRRLPLARSALCHGLAFTALGIHWSFGGSGASSAVVSWAVLGPQVLRTTGASLPECLALLALLAVVLTAFGCLETFVGADSLTPQQVTLPVGWDVAFCWLNILCPGVVSFLATNMVLSQLQVLRAVLGGQVCFVSCVCVCVSVCVCNPSPLFRRTLPTRTTPPYTTTPRVSRSMPTK